MNKLILKNLSETIFRIKYFIGHTNFYLYILHSIIYLRQSDNFSIISEINESYNIH